MKATVKNQEVKTGWEGPGFYVVHDDPDHDGWLFYLTHESDVDGEACGVTIVEHDGIQGTYFGQINMEGMRKLGPGETITIEP